MDNIYQAYFDEKYVFYLELVIQRNLLVLLKIADISVEKFAESLGVTAQTIRNLSAYETFISRTQFISIMSMFEMERRKGINKESVNTFLGILLDFNLYKKYSNSIIEFSLNNIFKKERKLSKRNFSAGTIAILGALSGAFFCPALLPTVVAGTTGFTVSGVLESITSEKKDDLYNDIKFLEESNDKDSFKWMNCLYNVRDSLHTSRYYKSFIESFKKCEPDKKGALEKKITLEKKIALFDDYINTLLNDLCTK